MDTTRDQAATAGTPRPGRYEIDTGRSTVAFATRHLFGLGAVRGRLALRDGTVKVADALADSAVRAAIDVASFRSRNPQRDLAVRSARLLDAKHHPLMAFASERLDGRTLSGTLTVRGVSRPVTLAIEQTAVSERSFSVRAVTRIDRTEFGVTGFRRLAARHLDVTLEITCERA